MTIKKGVLKFVGYTIPDTTIPEKSTVTSAISLAAPTQSPVIPPILCIHRSAKRNAAASAEIEHIPSMVNGMNK